MKGMWCNILAKPNMRIIKNEISIPDQSEVDLIAFGAVGKSATVGQTRRTRKGGKACSQAAREKSDNPVSQFSSLGTVQKSCHDHVYSIISKYCINTLNNCVNVPFVWLTHKRHTLYYTT